MHFIKGFLTGRSPLLVHHPMNDMLESHKACDLLPFFLGYWSHLLVLPHLCLQSTFPLNHSKRVCSTVRLTSFILHSPVKDRTFNSTFPNSCITLRPLTSSSNDAVLAKSTGVSIDLEAQHLKMRSSSSPWELLSAGSIWSRIVLLTRHFDIWVESGFPSAREGPICRHSPHAC